MIGARRRLLVVPLVAIVAPCLAGARAARAAGLEHPDVGTIAIGRGGAVAANPSDGLAFQHNPAGLAQQRGLRVMVDGNLSWQGLHFAPADGSPEVKNGASAFLAPAAAISYGMGRVGPLSALTFALGATGPSAVGRLSYPAAGAQRYALIDSDYFIAYASAAVAASIGDRFNVGLTLQLVHGTAKFTQAVWSGSSTGTDPAFDAIAHVDVSNGIVPTGVLGASFWATRRLVLGASYRPRFRFDASGTVRTDLPAVGQSIGARQIGDRTDFFIDFPDVVRVGAQHKLLAHDRLLVEANVVYEGWSRLRTIELHPRDVLIVGETVGTSRPLPPIILRRDFEDSVSVRAGADYEVVAGVVVRAGYLHETSAIPLRSTNVDFGNWTRDVIGGGGSVRLLAGVYLDVAYAHHFLGSRTVTNSEITQVVAPCVTPGCTDAPAPAVVGNGHYRASLDVASASVRVLVDEVRGRP